MDAAERVALVARVLRTLGGAYTPDAYCLTLVPGASPEAVLEAFGVDPAVAPGAPDHVDHVGQVVALGGPGYVVAAESNGWQGTRHEVRRRVAPRGRAASFYCNVNALTDPTLWEDGVELFSSEVLSQPEVPPDLLPFFAGLDFDADAVPEQPYETAGTWSCSLAVMERFTGVRLDGPGPCGPVSFHGFEPRLDDPGVVVGGSDSATSGLDDDSWATAHLLSAAGAVDRDRFLRLVAEVRAAGHAVQRELAWWGAREALRPVDLEDDPRVTPTLDSVRSPGGPSLAPETERLMRTAFHVPYGLPTPAGYLPLKALHHALDPDPTVAAVGAICDAAREAMHRSVSAVYPPGTVFSAPASHSQGWTAGQELVDRALERLGRADHPPARGGASPDPRENTEPREN